MGEVIFTFMQVAAPRVFLNLNGFGWFQQSFLPTRTLNKWGKMMIVDIQDLLVFECIRAVEHAQKHGRWVSDGWVSDVRVEFLSTCCQ